MEPEHADADARDGHIPLIGTAPCGLDTMPRMPSPPAAGRLAERPWRALSAPPDVLRVPTMLSEHELGLLYGLARDFADPAVGAVVDAGCFLGGSSAALLAGMRDSARALDRPAGRLLRPVPRRGVRAAQLVLAPAVRGGPGHSFRSFYDRNVAAYPTPHRVLEGDITEIGWTGEPIHVFFVDVLKTAGVNRAVQRDFLPHLVPGESVLIHQDYGYGAHPYIHIGVELIADRLRPLDWMPHGSHVFLVEQELTADVVAALPRPRSQRRGPVPADGPRDRPLQRRHAREPRGREGDAGVRPLGPGLRSR